MLGFVAADISIFNYQNASVVFPIYLWDKYHNITTHLYLLWLSYSLKQPLEINFHFQMEEPLWLMCPTGQTGREHNVDFLFFWVSFVCYVATV